MRRLSVSSNVIGCSTGSSAGLAPRSTLLTTAATARKRATWFSPYAQSAPASAKRCVRADQRQPVLESHTRHQRAVDNEESRRGHLRAFDAGLRKLLDRGSDAVDRSHGNVLERNSEFARCRISAFNEPGLKCRDARGLIEARETGRARQQLLEELQSLRLELLHQKRETRHVPARERKAGNELLLHRIGSGAEHDRNPVRCPHCRPCRAGIHRDDQIDVRTHHFFGNAHERLVPAAAGVEAIFDIRAFGPAELSHSLAEGREQRIIPIGIDGKISDAEDLQRLRQASEGRGQRSRSRPQHEPPATLHRSRILLLWLYPNNRNSAGNHPAIALWPSGLMTSRRG